ncbi:hypothetical protein DM01DRAFT_1408367 [Hesseltinella vesiculosa]|uniref:Uncharacterized protein n=1 Tax=Hesseltinella vesiculosa TaxID=101127 RepID=A0A1X2GFA7_9FUNG|nr:hypothetical protein DM01DRAFT_1408367 [Hesseltinella vesiculosa]
MTFTPSNQTIHDILFKLIPEQEQRLSLLCDSPKDAIVDRKRKAPLDDVTAAVEQGLSRHRPPGFPAFNLEQILLELDLHFKYIQTRKVIQHGVKLGEECGLKLLDEINTYINTGNIEGPEALAHIVKIRYLLRNILCIYATYWQVCKELFQAKNNLLEN